MTQSRDLADVVDLERYPIVDLRTAAAERLVRQSQADVDESGLCLLPGFLRPEAVETMVSEAESSRASAFFKDYLFPVYYDREAAESTDLPAGHPRRHRSPNTCGAIGYDMFPLDSPIRQLYESPSLTSFLSAVLRRDVYPCADPLIGLVLSVTGDGQELGWHFDGNDFVVSLMLRPSGQGGEFEYAPHIRSPEDENYDAVSRVLGGSRDDVISVALQPGTLALFRGQRSLHRVAPVAGPRERLIALFSYDSQPDMVYSDEVHLRVVGRTVALPVA